MRVRPVLSFSVKVRRLGRSNQEFLYISHAELEVMFNYSWVNTTERRWNFGLYRRREVSVCPVLCDTKVLRRKQWLCWMTVESTVCAGLPKTRIWIGRGNLIVVPAACKRQNTGQEKSSIEMGESRYRRYRAFSQPFPFLFFTDIATRPLPLF